MTVKLKSNFDGTCVSCQKGLTRHAYTWQIGPFWQDTLDLYIWSVNIFPNFWHWNCGATYILYLPWITVYPKKYAHGFCFAVLCCGYTLTDFPISIRLTSLALWQSNNCPSASKATLMNMDKYFMWIHYERLHNHNKTVCIFLGIYCMQRICFILCCGLIPNNLRISFRISSSEVRWKKINICWVALL